MNKNPIRIIPFLDIKNGLLIKGIILEGLRVLGKASNFSNHYYKNGADEICYIDNVATLYGTNNLSKFISETANNVFIPLSVGGGIKTLEDIKKMLSAGADKVCINSAAIDNISLLKQASRIFGSANITIVIQSIKINNKYYISKSSGRDLIKINSIDWAQKVEDNGGSPTSAAKLSAAKKALKEAEAAAKPAKKAKKAKKVKEVVEEIAVDEEE